MGAVEECVKDSWSLASEWPLGITKSVKAYLNAKMVKIRPLAHSLVCDAIPAEPILTLIKGLFTSTPSYGLQIAV
jgi:hypothetical protein